MTTLLGNKVKQTMELNDETIASSLMSTTTSAANAYLNAVVTSTTPELRAMYSSSLNQILNAHTTLTELSVNRGWEKPYTPPIQQLSNTVSKSLEIVRVTDK